MSAFIVIGTDGRLSGLVDDIVKCRPLNPAIATPISTGKIEKKGEDVFYNYHINNEGNAANDRGKFADLVRNQIAAFRKADTAPNLLNIFMLENPISNEEFQELDGWIKELESVYENDKNIHIYRILLTYEIDKPYDVVKQLPIEVLKCYLKSKDNYTFKNSSSVFYLSNRNTDGAAVSLGKEDHDFKLPRLLADFMMLLSSPNNTYGVFNAIHPAQSNEQCFSLGYAESMYYFPDVRKYYEHADNCSLYEHLLNDNDETANMQDDGKAMDVEQYPIGLDKRKEWLKQKYDDVPFNDNITLHKGSADFIIDDCLLNLKGLLSSAEQAIIAQKTKDINEKIEQLKANDNQGSKIKELQDELDTFCSSYPKNFQCREDIYNYYNSLEEKERQEYLDCAKNNYCRLIKYAKSKAFFDYIKGFDENGLQNSSNSDDSDLDNNLGCLSKFMFWRKRPTQKENTPPSTASPMPLLDYVKQIREQLKLKKKFEDFLKDREKIENDWESEKKYCEKFKLKEHTHHYYHLIDLPKLKTYQKVKFDERFMQILVQWNNEKNRNLTQLIELLGQNTEGYTDKFKYIDWADPFPFVSDISDSKLADVCNELYKKSSPFVHYETISKEDPNNVHIALYSDISNIKNRFANIKVNVTDSNKILPYHSMHIASKLCFFQFLPLDKAMLNNLCATRDNHPNPDEHSDSPTE